jgi:hypothetical protein
MIKQKFRISTKIDISNIFIKILIIVDLFICFVGKYYSSIVSVLPYVNLSFIMYAILKEQYISINRLFVTAIFVCYLCFSSFLNGSSFGAICAFITLFCVIYYFETVNINESFVLFIFIIGIASFVIALPNAKDIYNQFYVEKNMMTNPNGISMVLFIMLIYLKSFKNILPFKVPNYMFYCLWVICLALTYIMECRTVMIVTFIYGVLITFVPRKIWNNKKLILCVTTIIMIFGFVFPFIYVGLSGNSEINMFVFKMTGKFMFTGRELIWQRLIDVIKNNHKFFWIGLGSKNEYLIGHGYSMHNSYLGIFLNFGIIGVCMLIVYVLFQIKKIYDCSNKYLQKYQIDLIIGYICVLIISYTEVVLTTSNLVVICNMALGLAVNNKLKMRCRLQKL